jgi:hypothetical protein
MQTAVPTPATELTGDVACGGDVNRRQARILSFGKIILDCVPRQLKDEQRMAFPNQSEKRKRCDLSGSTSKSTLSNASKVITTRDHALSSAKSG